MNPAGQQNHMPTAYRAKANLSVARTNPRILYVIGQLRRGGAEQQLYYLLKYLRPQALVVSLSQGGYWADPIRELGIEVIELPRRGSWDFSRLLALVKISRRYSPDIIHIFLDNVPGLYGRMAALLTGNFRVVAGERAEAAVQQPYWYRRFKRLLNLWVAAVVCNSDANYQYFLRARIANRRKLSCIPNGLELEQFSDKTSCTLETPLGSVGRKVVGTVGSLMTEKSPGVFVRVAARVLAGYPDALFVHVGDGPLRKATEALSHQLGLGPSCLFLGQRSDVPRLLMKMDVFVLTSNTEGLPNALMEAMAAGLPCVVTDAGGCRELVIDEETGFVVPIDDEERLAERILRLLRDEKLRGRMGVRGREQMAGFDVWKMAQRYELLYQSVLTGGQ
jgi:glycosyltransferase involved in cell wall biosynthesis